MRHERDMIIRVEELLHGRRLLVHRYQHVPLFEGHFGEGTPDVVEHVADTAIFRYRHLYLLDARQHAM